MHGGDIKCRAMREMMKLVIYEKLCDMFCVVLVAIRLEKNINSLTTCKQLVHVVGMEI